MKSFYWFSVVLFIFAFLSTPVSASVIINEIMYDLSEGSDTGREWIELLNNGTSPIDMAGWKLFEANTNHALSVFQGNETLSPGGFGIIASDPSKFLIDNAGFVGTIFDSSFSLSNTEESLSIRDSNLIDIDSVAYSSDMGGAGDGGSLQKINGVWKGAVPTPGAQNLEQALPQTQQQAQSTQQVNSSTGSNTGVVPAQNATSKTTSSTTPEPQIFASAGPAKRAGVVGGDIIFSGSVWGSKKEPIENARLVWNFGDGTIKEGKNVAHTYAYPGTYMVVLGASSGIYSATERVSVEVTVANILISSIGDADSFFIELYNRSQSVLDLSSWSIRTPSEKFVFHSNTILASDSKIKIPSSATQFKVYSNEVSLYYPNGTISTNFKESQNVQNDVSPLTTIVKSVSSSVAKKSISSSKDKIPEVGAIKPIPINSSSDSLAVAGVKMETGFEQDSSQQLASPIGSPGQSNLWWWLAGVLMISLTGMSATYIMGRKTPTELIEQEANEYTITEEEDDTKIPF